MWSSLELESGNAEPSTAPRIFVLNEGITPELLSRTVPAVANVNINQSSGVHIGPQFVTVTQIVENRDLERANPRPRVPPPLPDRNNVKNRKHWIRFCWAGIILAVLLTIALIVHLVIIAKTTESLRIDQVPWRVTRGMWGARCAFINATLDAFSPIKLVIIQHTVSPECSEFESCADEMRNLQGFFLDTPHLGYDLPYNFVIGNDGRVYDSREWNKEGAHTAGYNRCSIGISFVGDYREDICDHSRVTNLQMSRLRMLLQEGVDQGYLAPDYALVGAMDLRHTASPGMNLYRAISTLEHFDSTSNFRDKTCEELFR